jgi:hypothetical protein
MRKHLLIVGILIAVVAMAAAVGLARPAEATSTWGCSCHGSNMHSGGGTANAHANEYAGNRCATCHQLDNPATDPVQTSVCSSQCHTAFTVGAGATGGNNLAAWHETNTTATCSGCHTIVTNYTITSSADANGSISPFGAQTVAAGGSLTFTITSADGYHIADVLVDNVSVGTPTSYPFTAVAGNHTISATFEADVVASDYFITPTAGANGTITPPDAQLVVVGTPMTFDIAADPTYRIKEVLVDGISVGTPSSYTFANAIAGNHTISATFEADVVPGVNAQVTVRVVDDAGNLIDQAKVVMRARHSAPMVAYTDSVGMVSFADVSYGTYKLDVSKQGYIRSSDTLVVDSPTVGTTETLLQRGHHHDGDSDDDHGGHEGDHDKEHHSSNSQAPR